MRLADAHGWLAWKDFPGRCRLGVVKGADLLGQGPVSALPVVARRRR